MFSKAIFILFFLGFTGLIQSCGNHTEPIPEVNAKKSKFITEELICTVTPNIEGVEQKTFTIKVNDGGGDKEEKYFHDFEVKLSHISAISGECCSYPPHYRLWVSKKKENSDDYELLKEISWPEEQFEVFDHNKSSSLKFRCQKVKIGA